MSWFSRINYRISLIYRIFIFFWNVTPKYFAEILNRLGYFDLEAERKGFRNEFLNYSPHACPWFPKVQRFIIDACIHVYARIHLSIIIENSHALCRLWPHCSDACHDDKAKPSCKRLNVAKPRLESQLFKVKQKGSIKFPEQVSRESAIILIVDITLV